MKDTEAQPLVLRHDQDHIARLTLNSPAKYNALSTDMILAISDALDSIADDPQIRVVILAANGKAFCVGHDLHEMQSVRQDTDSGHSAHERLFLLCAAMMQKLVALPQPVIAEVQGVAAAAGCQLVASCDMAVAAEGVRFGVNGINIGLFCATPMVALTRAIAPRAAFELLMTGELIDAQRAKELGLVNRVTAAQDLQAQTMALAQIIAAKLPAAVRLGKRAFHAQNDMDLPEAYRACSDVICENLGLPDTAEGIQAFLEKRAPNWD